MATLRFYYDIVCPFAYLASTRVRALAREAGVGLEYCPVLLGGIFKGTGAVDDPNVAMPAAKARLTRLDALRQADLGKVPFAWNPRHPQRSVTAMRLLLAVDESRRPALTDALYQAYWVDGRDITDHAVLQDVAAPFDLDVARVDADPAIRQALFDATDHAVSIGAFGVPTLELDGRIWWGADRMDLVRAALGLGDDGDSPTIVPGARRHLAFFHDFSSPFSYLASTQVRLVAEANNAELEHVPFLLGALFKEIGTPMVPLHSFVQARQDYQLRDMREWADWWGVDFRFPSVFPQRTVAALRVAIAEPRATDALYRGIWVDDRDLGDRDQLRGLLDDAGFDGVALLERTADPAIKQQLFANTQRAVAVGACGAPTFVVDGAHVFWGQDRLGMVGQALAGWEPPNLPPL